MAFHDKFQTDKIAVQIIKTRNDESDKIAKVIKYLEKVVL